MFSKRLPLDLARLAVAAAVTLACLIAIFLFRGPNPGYGDLTWPFCAARAVINGSDPYACVLTYNGRLWPTNPLTTALAVLPFLVFGDWAGAAVFAASSGLLAYGALRDRSIWRLLAFASVGYWEAFFFLQWSPLLAALVLLPGLLPLALVKPHVGLPIILTNLTRRRLLGLVGFGLLSLAVDPVWPFKWLPQAQGYNGHIPLLALPVGPLLALAALRWRDTRARFLLLAAIVPQRLFYDTLPLYLLANTWQEMLGMCVLGWVSFLMVPILPIPPGVLIVSSTFLPVLFLVLRPLAARSPSTTCPLPDHPS